MTLSSRLLLLILICLVPLSGAQLYAQYRLHQEQKTELAALAMRQVELANGDLVSIAEGLRALAMAVALLPSVREARPGCAEPLKAVQRYAPAVLFFAAFDQSGAPLCNSLGTSPQLRTEPWVQDLLAHPAEQMGTLSRLANGHAFVPFVVRTAHPDSPVALVVAALSLDWLASHLRQVRVSPAEAPRSSVLYVTDRNGVVIGLSPDMPQRIGAKLPSELQYVIGARQPGTWTVTDPAENTRLLAAVPADQPRTGLTAVETLALDDLAPGLLRITWHGILPLLLTALLAVALAWLIGLHFIARPTGLLLSAARRWRDGDLSARARITHSGSEFAILAESFNAMASSLQARELERRLHEELLEAQVVERTRALSDSNNRLQVEIAEREKTEAALHQGQKLQAVGQLAGGIAHDFNNMLATVLGSLELNWAAWS